MKGMKFIALVVGVLAIGETLAQAPAGYYDPAQGLTGEPLRTALMGIIDNHDVQSYNSLHTHFQSTDNKGNGQVWDMYSDNPGGTPPYTYTLGSNTCGNYSGEGDCYNREHSFPKSWFNDQSPMSSDLFHLYPTDGYVNGQRSNYAYSEVDLPAWTSLNGSKRGNSSFPGYAGSAFEPIDEYKGDLARTYFYMMTRYKTSVNNWNSVMLDGDNLSEWACTLLLQWSASDPVSQKEIDRNNAVFAIQNNRNPFIDHPEWIDSIWSHTTSNVGAAELKAPQWNAWYTEGQVHLRFDQSPQGEIRILNAAGQTVSTQIPTEMYEQINLPTVPGLYLVIWQSANHLQVHKVLQP